MKREGNVWIRVFPDKVVTRKPAEVRMGKGKGNPKDGQLLLNQAVSCLKQMVYLLKLRKTQWNWLHKSFPIKTKFIVRRDLTA
jgi:large subunit ribosomal protein L16